MSKLQQEADGYIDLENLGGYIDLEDLEVPPQPGPSVSLSILLGAANMIPYAAGPFRFTVPAGQASVVLLKVPSRGYITSFRFAKVTVNGQDDANAALDLYTEENAAQAAASSSAAPTLPTQSRYAGQSTLSADVTTTTADTLTVADPTAFPSVPGFKITIGSEELIVTQITGSVFTVARGVNSTVAATHAKDTAVVLTGYQEIESGTTPGGAYQNFRVVPTGTLNYTAGTPVNLSEKHYAYQNKDGGGPTNRKRRLYLVITPSGDDDKTYELAMDIVMPMAI